MVTDNTEDRIDEINHPNDPTLVTQHTGNRNVVASDTDHVRHGLDDNADNDAEKGAALGGLGGAAVGAAAGAIAGPVGVIVGAIAGGLVGAGASGAAVAAIDSMDNDNTISGIGSGVTRDSDGRRVDASAVPASTLAGNTATPDAHGHNIVTGGQAHTESGDSGLAGGAIVGGVVGAAVGGPVGAIVGGTLGSLAGGVAGDAAEAADEEDLTMAGTRGTGYTENYTPETEVLSNPGIYNPGAPMTGTAMTGLNPTIVNNTSYDDAAYDGATATDGHNVVTGGAATTEAGDDGLVGGAVVGGVVGAAVGGPIGAVVGGTLGSLAGGVAGDAAEAAADDETNIRVNSRDV